MTTTTLSQANDVLRSAVKTRLDATPKDDPKMVGYKAPPLAGCKPAEECAADVLSRAASCCDGQRLRGDSLLKDDRTPAEQALHDAIDAVRDRHGKYGPPTEHFARTASLVNAAFGTTFTAADWALVMVLDKIARQLGTQATDDAAIDIAGYAACHQECRRK